MLSRATAASLASGNSRPAAANVCGTITQIPNPSRVNPAIPAQAPGAGRDHAEPGRGQHRPEPHHGHRPDRCTPKSPTVRPSSIVTM